MTTCTIKHVLFKHEFLLPYLPQVPSSYVSLQHLIAEEVKVCQQKEIPPVLNQKEFASLADKIPEGDISDPEELSLGRSCDPLLMKSLSTSFPHSLVHSPTFSVRNSTIEGQKKLHA